VRDYGGATACGGKSVARGKGIVVRWPDLWDETKGNER